VGELTMGAIIVQFKKVLKWTQILELQEKEVEVGEDLSK
jgi:hypothetical protein